MEKEKINHCKMYLNEEKQGIELYFDEKPGSEILILLNKSNFKYHGKKRYWYAKQTPDNLEFAELIKSETISTAPHIGENSQPVNEYGIHVGDIFVYSYGYEQTNVIFFQVVALKGKTSVLLKEICQKCVQTLGSMSEKVVPCKDDFISERAEFTKRVRSYDNGDVFISMKSGTANLTDEKKEHYQSSYA